MRLVLDSDEQLAVFGVYEISGCSLDKPKLAVWQCAESGTKMFQAIVDHFVIARADVYVFT